MINAKFQGPMWRRIGAGVLGLGAFLMLPYPSIAGERGQNAGDVRQGRRADFSGKVSGVSPSRNRGADVSGDL